jgi:hypothetical protein
MAHDLPPHRKFTFFWLVLAAAALSLLVWAGISDGPPDNLDPSYQMISKFDD